MRSLLLFFAILATSCSKSDSKGGYKPPDVAASIKKLGGAAEPVVAVIEKLSKLPPSTGPITLDAGAFATPKFPEKPNIAIVYREDLVDLTTPAKHAYEIRPEEAFPISNTPMGCAFLLRKGAPTAGNDPFSTKDRADHLLQTCAGLKYLVVIDTEKAVPPSVDESSHTFTPGFFKGAITVYSNQRYQGTRWLSGFGDSEGQRDHALQQG
jgi:hypothetical protein